VKMVCFLWNINGWRKSVLNRKIQHRLSNKSKHVQIMYILFHMSIKCIIFVNNYRIEIRSVQWELFLGQPVMSLSC